MLLGKQLPKEMCLLVFEFAMSAEKVPLDPRVWVCMVVRGTQLI